MVPARWRSVLPTSGPGAGKQSEAGGSGQQAPPLRCWGPAEANEDPDLQLCNTTWARTVAGTAAAFFWIFAGLLVLGLAADQEGPETVTALRFAGFMLMFYVPVSVIAIPNLRMHIFCGLQPWFALAPTFTPRRIRKAAYEQGLGKMCQVRAFCAPIALHAGWLALYVLLACIRIGGSRQFFGYIVIYGAGHVLCIAFAELFVDRLTPALHREYAANTGIAGGIVMVGFFIVTSGFALLQRYVGSWLGWFAGLLVQLYEGVGVMLIGRIFTRELLKPGVREAMAGTQQGLQISAIVSLLQGLAEGARMTLLVADVSDGNHERAWVYMLLGSLLVNIPSRLGWQAWLLQWATGGRLRVDNCYWLLQEVRYTMGYPCFACLAPIAAVRWLLGHSLLPGGRAELAWALLCALAAEALEDLLVACLSRCGLRPEGAGACGRGGDGGAAAACAEQSMRLPGAAGGAEEGMQADCAGGPALACPEAAARTDKECFLHGEMHFGRLPLWSHFSVVMMVQFHVVLFLVIFANGFEYVLGFCDEPGYRGVARGLVWWPLMSADHPCG